jgi:ABC-type anion transport system duplicated permease subunit
VVRLIIATRSSGPPASGKIIKEMPGSVASGILYITYSECVSVALVI